MEFLPEDKNLVLMAGDGYVAGTALALMLIPSPAFPDSQAHPYREHGLAQAKVALRIKLIAMWLAVALFAIWLFGHLSSSDFPALPSDRSLFATIPLFGIADMIAAVQALSIAKHKDDSPIRQQERGDTAGQLYSVALVSVYLGFWLSTVAFPN